MILKQLRLQNFRLFTSKQLDFIKQTTLILGPNASGKTNILEAIYLLASGKSFRAIKEAEVIRNGADFSVIQSTINPDKIEDPRQSQDNQQSTINLEIILTKGEVQGKKTARKMFKVNGVGKRWKDFVANFSAVLFRPEDIDIILGTPSIRRNYLDSVLTQTDWKYRVSLITYKKGLRQRNKLLSKIKDGEAQRSQLIFWNQLLIKNGEFITEKRQSLIEFYNQYLQSYKNLFKGKINIKIDYDKSIISESRLDKYKQAEIGAGVTLVGPHRDDIVFKIQNSELRIQKERDLRVFGSRGEQRMAVFALKLTEVEFIIKRSGRRPILLLDDIFSELDKIHRNQIINIVPRQQTIITTTDLNMIDKRLRDKMEVVELNA